MDLPDFMQHLYLQRFKYDVSAVTLTPARDRPGLTPLGQVWHVLPQDLQRTFASAALIVFSEVGGPAVRFQGRHKVRVFPNGDIDANVSAKIYSRLPAFEEKIHELSTHRHL